MRAFAVALLAAAAVSAPAQDPAMRPNIVVILVDDMGFSDLGCYGGEIPTPHLDALASGGLRFTQFYNTGRCCPTRASFLTGLYSHQAGVGHMNANLGRPGYRGTLNDHCVTLGDVARERSMWPHARGFDSVYAVPERGGFYFEAKKGQG